MESPAGGAYVRPEAITAVTAESNEIFVLVGGSRMRWSSHKDAAEASKVAADLVAQLTPAHDSKVVRQTVKKEPTK